MFAHAIETTFVRQECEAEIDEQTAASQAERYSLFLEEIVAAGKQAAEEALGDFAKLGLEDGMRAIKGAQKTAQDIRALKGDATQMDQMVSKLQAAYTKAADEVAAAKEAADEEAAAKKAADEEAAAKKAADEEAAAADEEAAAKKAADEVAAAKEAADDEAAAKDEEVAAADEEASSKKAFYEQAASLCKKEITETRTIQAKQDSDHTTEEALVASVDTQEVEQALADAKIAAGRMTEMVAKLETAAAAKRAADQAALAANQARDEDFLRKTSNQEIVRVDGSDQECCSACSLQ